MAFLTRLNDTEIVDMMNTARLARPPYSEPVYSTIAFTLFSVESLESRMKSY